MSHTREIRYDLALVDPIMSLILSVPGAALFWFILFITPLQPQSILFFVMAFLLSIGALNALVKLLFRQLFHRPVLEMTADGITYASPYMPWRQIVVPWSDVVRLSTLRQSFPRSTTRTYFVVHTRHPERYRSPRARRLRAWWNPAMQDAAIAVSFTWLGVGISPAKRQKFMERITTTFAREIGRYGMTVKVAAR